MYPGPIKGILAIADLEKTGRLNKALLADAGDLQQLPAIAKSTVCLAILNEIAGHQLIQPGHMAQQRYAGRVQIDAHLIDARLNNGIERVAQLLSRDIVLIKPDANMLRIDLDQLAEWILQAAANGDGATHRGVKMGELFLADGAGRVNAGAGLVDDNVGQLRQCFGQRRRRGRGWLGRGWSDG